MSESENKQDQYEKIEDEKTEALARYIESLGLESLARDISEERIVRRILESRIAYDYYSVQSEIWKDRSEKALERAVSAQALLFDKAASYNNVVLTLGYAGFFAIWNIVSNQLKPAENAVIGLSLGISLGIFISWTILISVLLTLKVRRYAVIAGTEFNTLSDEIEAHKQAEDKAKRASFRLQRFWPFVFFDTVLTSLFPGLLLLLELLDFITGFEWDLTENIWNWFT